MSINIEREKNIAFAIEKVTSLLSCGPVDRALLEKMASVLRDLGKNEALFPLTDFPVPSEDNPKRSNRYLLYQSPSNELTLYLNVILPGKSTKPHNHTTWAIISGIAGTERNRLYRRVDDGSSKTHAKLEVSDEIDVSAGTGITMMPDDIHSIHGGDHGICRQFHMYGQPLEFLVNRVGYDLTTGEIKNYNANFMSKTVAKK